MYKLLDWLLLQWYVIYKYIWSCLTNTFTDSSGPFNYVIELAMELYCVNFMKFHHRMCKLHTYNKLHSVIGRVCFMELYHRAGELYEIILNIV